MDTSEALIFQIRTVDGRVRVADANPFLVRSTEAAEFQRSDVPYIVRTRT